MGRADRGAAVLDAGDALLVAQREWGAIVAALIRATGDWDLAEECAQDAVERAIQRWPVDGVPDRPAAWLTTTARHRAIDVLRRRRVEARKLEEVAAMEHEGDGPAATAPFDDQLCLVFTCCHPALSMEARVALTLRSVAGLTSAEIARAFLVEERTMVQRLFRAKRKIRDAAIPFRVPPADRLAERLDDVLAVLYLVFNEGYRPAAGHDASRVALTSEALRLASLLVELLPEPEAVGLLALMELHDARSAGRVDAAGELVPLDEQDRTRWDRPRIDRAAAMLDAAVARGHPGPYQLQAAIAACHATAAHAADTDWLQIAALYERLASLVPGPVVELNRAVAVSMADGPDAGLRIVDALATTGELAGYHLLPATRADLLRRAGRRTEAATAYRQAIALAANQADRRFLERRLAALDPG
ncbi:MAG TPA: sigma-70 family RNA polymerase sigma factor [Ilumatobacteraceae bacterium]|nr:sigma-70 family RNA polymerase sigma factor [Ilumatobacteraceae bacterium]